jgi:hypothetical protein
VSIRFLADADLNHNIVRGVRVREPRIDFKSADEACLRKLSDIEVLEIAAKEGRLLVTHDESTMPVHYAERLASGRNCPGVLIAPQSVPIANIIESLLIIWSASELPEWIGHLWYLPSMSRHVFR